MSLMICNSMTTWDGWFIISVLVCIALIVESYMLWKSMKGRNSKNDSDTLRVNYLLNVIHELKTPLTLIIGPLHKELVKMKKGTPQYNKIFGSYNQALRMRSLVLTVLDAHRIEEGGAKLNPEPVDYNVWVSDIAKGFADEMENRHTKLLLQMDNAVGRIDIDSPKLENVLTNILINALKHSPVESTVTVGTRILSNNIVRTFVQDQGPGLKGVDTKKLFDRFYQGLTEKTGSGMGLAYAQTIVDLHGGHMGAQDIPEGGSQFYFDLPGNKPH